MHSGLASFFGVSAAILFFISLGPYLIEIFQHKTKPQRATWWIWFVLNIVALLAQWAAGATWSLLFSGAQTILTATIAILSINYGYGKFTRKDGLALVVAAIGVVLWQLTSQPLVALLIVVAVDLLGFYLLLLKTWESPQTEAFSTWVIASFASICGMLAVNTLNFTRLLYPSYIFLGNLFMVFVILYRRPKITARVK